MYPREQLFAFAGLWENWRDNAGGKSAEWIRTCAIIGEPNELLVPIHNRMPVMRTDRAEAVYASQRIRVCAPLTGAQARLNGRA